MNAPKNKTIAAVVVTFNRSRLLVECLRAILRQSIALSRIYVIDNASTDGTPEMLATSGLLELPTISYKRLDSNLGGAGGFSYGISLAHSEGWDWIWLMDDDAEPEPDCLLTLVDGISRLELSCDEPACICPRVVNYFSREFEWHQHKRLTGYYFDKPVSLEEIRFQRIDGNAFVGPLFSRACVSLLGVPRAEFFLWTDDLDYTYRVSKAGAVWLDNSAIILHKDNTQGNPGPIKSYYWIRNYLWFVANTIPANEKLSFVGRVRWILAICKIVYRSFLMSSRFLLRGIMPLQTSLLPIRGILDALFNRSGKCPE